jgi:hypothetical protein
MGNGLGETGGGRGETGDGPYETDAEGGTTLAPPVPERTPGSGADPIG